MMRAEKFLRAAELAGDDGSSFDSALLAHDQRHLRRKLVRLQSGETMLVDFPRAVALGTGDMLLLDDGRRIGIVAADEQLYDIRAGDARHLAELAWHIGNRHLAAAIEADRILIQRDHVIKAMLEGLGATVTDVVEPFEPVRGAYSGHGHAHGHADARHHHEAHAGSDGHHHD